MFRLCRLCLRVSEKLDKNNRSLTIFCFLFLGYALLFLVCSVAIVNLLFGFGFQFHNVDLAYNFKGPDVLDVGVDGEGNVIVEDLERFYVHAMGLLPVIVKKLLVSGFIAGFCFVMMFIEGRNLVLCIEKCKRGGVKL